METSFTTAGGCVACICGSCPKGYTGDRTCPNLCQGIPGQYTCHYRETYCSNINISTYNAFTLDNKTSHTRGSDYSSLSPNSYIEK